MKKWIVLMIMLSAAVISSCGSDVPKENGLYAIFETNFGNFTAKLYYDITPVTVGNFAGLAEGLIESTDPKTEEKTKKHFYNGLIFHRIIDGFVIQGGDPLGAGYGGPGYSFPDEFDSSLTHNKAGILSMANSGPNTNGSQFFITLKETPHLDGAHTVFGEIVSGMNVIEKIAKVKVDPNTSKPYSDVYIKNLKIVAVGDDAKKFDPVEAFSEENRKKIVEKNMQKKEAEFSKILEDNKASYEALLKKLGVDMNKIVTNESGIKYAIVKNGGASEVERGNTVAFNYSGYLINGTMFDSNSERGEPIEFPIGVGRLIPGWDDGIPGMKVGERRVLIIPYYMGYGERGAPPVIPAKATLIFDVEVVGKK